MDVRLPEELLTYKELKIKEIKNDRKNLIWIWVVFLLAILLGGI